MFISKTEANECSKSKTDFAVADDSLIGHKRSKRMQQVDGGEEKGKMRPTKSRYHIEHEKLFTNPTGNSYLQASRFAYICLAVILILHQVQAEEAHDANQLAHHSQRPQSAIFKDLSGPMSGKIQTLDVICGKNFMTVRAEFSAPFYGIVFSKGTYGHENCIYVKPNSGLTHAAFNVYYDQCGTKPDLQGKFYENTIVIQYGSDIIEAYDEAKRLRCEWFEAYEKPATFKPAIPVADLEVVEMNFQGDDIDCWMEIQDGSGPWSREVSKIVPVGQPMTIVVAINDYNGQFDMRVKSCVAHDGVQQPIALTDEFGCVLRPKMLTPFTKIKNPGGAHKKATVLSYSRFLAFKFPDSMTVQIQCTVEVCRHGCADACQRVPSIAATTIQPELSLSAKWPAAPNQAALENSQPWSGNRQQPNYASSRPQLFPARSSPSGFVGQPSMPAASQSAPVANDQPAPQSLSSTDELTGSDSNHQPSIVANQRQLPPQGQRRSQESPIQSQQQLNEARVPQYLVPNSARRIQAATFGSVINNRQQAPVSEAPSTLQTSPTETVTEPPSTTAQPAASSTQGETSATSVEQAPSSESQSAKTSGLEESNSAKDAQDQSQLDEQHGGQISKVSSIEAQSDNKAESSQVNPTVVAPDESSSNPDAQPGQFTDSKPSVQADEISSAESKVANQDYNGAPSSSSSLKTVEVEIPVDDEQSGAGVPANSNQQQFNSVRISNAQESDLNAAGSSGLPVYTEPIEYQRPNNLAGNNMAHHRGVSNYLPADQIIQPRETSTIEKRDKGEESSIEAMMASGKSRFGARSQPHAGSTQNIQDGQASNSARLQPGNQKSADEQGVNTDGSESGLDRILIDRSDDSSSLSELANSPSLVNNEPDSGKASGESHASHDHRDGGDDSLAVAASNPDSSKIKPVVGTEELASGPIQIEDRIGAAPQDSLEETLSKLQQQIPQSAALVGNSQVSASDGQARSDNPSQKVEIANERNDKPSPDLGDQRSDSHGAMIAPPKNNADSGLAANQPFPNVAGQAKVIPDPANSLGSRGAMLAQASNIEGSPSSVSRPGAGYEKTGQHSTNEKPKQVESADSALKPVAQITNVPVAIGFPQAQIPVVHQQMNQHLAFMQQQQQQQQQQHLQQQQQLLKPHTSPKPRSRFNLLSPQAALSAVASRFKPKSTHSPNQQPQQLPQNPLPAQQPALYNLYSAQGAQQRPQAFYTANRVQQPLQQQIAVNRQPVPSGQLQGMFGRLGASLQHQPQQTPNPQQPLVRIRRSAIQPKGKQGTGELGMTKSFMVVTGLDLDFQPNLTDTELPPIFEGRRSSSESDVIYGVCMPIVSLTFVLTCAFWLVVFLTCFCIYMFVKSRRYRNRVASELVKQETL